LQWLSRLAGPKGQKHPEEVLAPQPEEVGRQEVPDYGQVEGRDLPTVLAVVDEAEAFRPGQYSQVVQAEEVADHPQGGQVGRQGPHGADQDGPVSGVREVVVRLEAGREAGDVGRAVDLNGQGAVGQAGRCLNGEGLRATVLGVHGEGEGERLLRGQHLDSVPGDMGRRGSSARGYYVIHLARPDRQPTGTGFFPKGRRGRMIGVHMPCLGAVPL
jgi:hypothetical protein